MKRSTSLNYFIAIPKKKVLLMVKKNEAELYVLHSKFKKKKSYSFVGSVSISSSFVNRLLFLLEKLLHPIWNQRLLNKGISTLPNQVLPLLGIWISGRNDTKMKHGWRRYIQTAVPWGMCTGSCPLVHRSCFPSLILHLFQTGSSALPSTRYPSNKFLPMLSARVCFYCLLIK